MNYQIVTFAEAKQPEYKEKKGEGYIQYGDKNDYPSYLIELFNKSAKHGAIIRSKVHYICGNGWSGNDAFVQHPNRTETLADLSKKVSLDIELFGGAFIEVIWGTGRVAEVWHCDYSKFRTNNDNTQFWYKKDWKDRGEQAIVYPAFNPKVPTGTQIYYVKEYRPNTGSYSLPSYFGGLNYIESDIEVSKHVLGNAKTGFSASKLITLPNGEPSPDEQRVVHNKFKNTYTGADGIKYMLAFVNDASRKPIVDDLGQSDLTKEDFSRVDELIQVNIFSAHQITTPSIFGIAQAGTLGSRSEMQDGYEIFKNTYVNHKQMALESTFNMLSGYAGYPEDLKIIPTEPIGLQLSENTLLAIMTKDELREKIGLQKLTEIAQPSQFASEDFSLFNEFGESAEKFEVWKQRGVFDEIQFADVTQLQANVLDLIAKDKRITPEVIADVLKEDIGVVKRIIKDLIDRDFIKTKENKIGSGIDENIEIERSLTKPLAKIIEEIKPITREFLVRYSYEWKAGFSDNDITTSRPFCKYLVTNNKMYSRSEIEQMSSRVGYSVWDRKGGWYTIPKTDKHSPECRHQWVSNIVTRK
jgi:DNA-binding MarR family transcriptional regulator